jgi:hypothetical protein
LVLQRRSCHHHCVCVCATNKTTNKVVFLKIIIMFGFEMDMIHWFHLTPVYILVCIYAF